MYKYCVDCLRRSPKGHNSN